MKSPVCHKSAVENEKVFLAGVAEQEGKLVTNGGRVLCVTALGESVFEAQQKALKLAEQIQWSGRFYRRDIGYRAVEREQQKITTLNVKVSHGL